MKRQLIYDKSLKKNAQRELRKETDHRPLANVSHTHIMDLEDGKKAPAFDKVMQILHAYHADVQEFLRETGYLPKNVEPAALGKMRKIPVISWVAAGKWAETGESFHEEEALEWIDSDVKGEHNFALRVKGDSMEPEFNEGDILIVSPTVHPVAAYGELTMHPARDYSSINHNLSALSRAATGQGLGTATILLRRTTRKRQRLSSTRSLTAPGSFTR